MTEQQTAPINQYLQPLFDHKKLLLAIWAAVIFLGVAVGLAAPVSYSSTAAILVYPSSGDPTKALETDDADIDMPTELRIATSQAVINLVVDRLAEQGVASDPKVLSDNITASSTKESTILDVTFVAETPELASAGANAFAESYLEFRGQLASGNKLSAESAINGRITILQERLVLLQLQLTNAGAGDRVILNSEKATVEADLAAQQVALGALSTPTIDATVIIDEAETPDSPEGLGLTQILVGAIAGGMVAGVVAAYVLAAYRAGKPPTEDSDQRSTDDHTATATGAEPTTAETTRAQPVEIDKPEEREPTPLTALTAGDSQGDRERTTAATATDTSAAAIPVTATETPVPTDRDTAEAAATDAVLADLIRPTGSEPAQGHRTSTDEAANDTDNAERTRAMIVSGDMEPVIRYLQSLGTSGSVTSMVVGEREPESAAAVAVALGEALHTLGARVLVVDAGLDRPTLDSTLRISRGDGLVEVLSGTKTLSETTRPVNRSEGFDLLSVGSMSTTSTVPAIRAASFERFLNEARLEYHTVLVVGGVLEDNEIVAEVAPLTEGVIIGTDRVAGDLADPNLHDLVAALPTPTLELLSAASVGDVAATSGSIVSGM